EVDDSPEIQAAQEVFLILQDFDLTRQGQVRPPMPLFRRWGREGALITVNGQTAPVLDLPQGGLLRLRLLNASAARYYHLQLTDHPWWLMAMDGVALETPVPQETVLLAPGERLDFLVPGQAAPRTYDLRSLPYDRGIMTMAGAMGHGPMMGPGRGMARPLNQPVILARLRYQGQTTPVALPTTLGQVEVLPEPTILREFVLDHGIDPVTADPFLINGRAFDHHRVDTQVKLDSVEDWVIQNQAGMDHPFHLHTNRFQVISRNGQPEPLRAWKDVVNIPAYETVRIRIPFRDFAGKTVYHCHILDHEDQGMMGVIEMQPS
ncbi:MAG TPA: multicopper oxidase domain-containing protein, partial [Leptolyngbyaceae cyanobacterium M65_K2018_010]|nr:multicopper oxidase domain-containing protein [Leptolyngbyaceae cyanobacterium M65_K2018_010]